MVKISENTDRQTIAKLKNGDIQAFQDIFNAHSTNLFHFAFSYLKNTFESEEIVQDVFIRIWEMRTEIDEKKSFKSFIYRMTVNKVFNQMKHRVVKQKYEGYIQNFDQSYSDSPEALMHYEELNEKVGSLILKLPSQQQAIFKLSRIEGFSNPEIAEKLGLSIRTIENQIFRATKVLKENLPSDYLFALICLFSGLISC